MAKGLSINRVCTFLIDLIPADLESPLAQFNHTLPDKEGMKSLLATINKELGEKSLESRILDQVFQTYWPQFEKQFSEILSAAPEVSSSSPQRSPDEILTEILYNTRALDKRIRLIEQNKKKLPWNCNESYIDINNVEDVFRYKFSNELGIRKDDIKKILIDYVDLERVNIKETDDALHVIVPDLGEEENSKIRILLNMMEKKGFLRRSKETS